MIPPYIGDALTKYYDSTNQPDLAVRQHISMASQRLSDVNSYGGDQTEPVIRDADRVYTCHYHSSSHERGATMVFDFREDPPIVKVDFGEEVKKLRNHAILFQDQRGEVFSWCDITLRELINIFDNGILAVRVMRNDHPTIFIKNNKADYL